MRFPCLLFAAVLALFLAAPPRAGSGSGPDEPDPFRLHAHTEQIGETRVSWFSWAPRDLASGAPLLVAVSPEGEAALAFASRAGLLEMAAAQGARLVLVDATAAGALPRILDEILVRAAG